MDFQQPIQQQPDQQPVNQQPNQNIQPNPVVIQSPKNTWKIIILIIVGVLILSGVSYGAYYWWPKNNKPVVAPAIYETANWQTYRNEEYGFEFKYPSQFYVVSESLGNAESGNIRFSVALDDIQFKGQDRFRRYTTVSVQEKSSLQNFLNGLVNDMTGEKLIVTKQEKVSDSPLLYKIYIGNLDSFQGVAIKDNIYFHIVSGSGPTVDQILSTFKFTDQKEIQELTYSDPLGQYVYKKSEFNVKSALSEEGFIELSAFTAQDKGITYEFSFKAHPEYGSWSVSVMQNKPKYKNQDEFNKDFPVEGVGLYFYPAQVSDNYLLFSSGCAGAVSVGVIDRCGTIQAEIGPTIKLK